MVTEVIVEPAWNPPNVHDADKRRNVARTSDGILHAVYVDAGPFVTDVFYRWSDDDGASWSSSTRLSVGDSYRNKMPSISADADDKLYVTWWHDTGAGTINFRRWNGSSWDGIGTVESSGNYQQHCDNSLDYDGDVHIHYQYVSGSYRSMSLKIWDGSFGSRIDLHNTVTASGKTQPHGVTDTGNSDHWVFWQFQTASYRDIYAAIYSSGSYGSASVIQAGTTNHSQYPGVSVDSSDDLHLVYTRITSPRKIYYKKYTGSWTAEAIIASNGTYNSQRATIAINAIDEIDVCYERAAASGRNIYHLHSTDEAPSWGSEEALTTGTDLHYWANMWCRNSVGAQDKAAAGYACTWCDITNTDFVFAYSADFATAGGVFYEKFAAAGIGIATSVTKNITKVVGAGLGIVAAVTKSITKKVSAGLGIAASAEKFLTRTRQVVVHIGITASHSKSITKKVSAGVGIAAVRTKGVIKTAAANIGVAASHIKNITKAVSAGIEVAAAHTKDITKHVAATIGITAAADAIKLFLVNVAANIGIAASVTKGITKQVAANLGIGTVVSATKSTLINAAASIGIAASHTKVIVKQVGANIAITGTIIKNIIRNVSAGVEIAAVATKVFTKQVSMSIGVAADAVKNVTKAVAANIGIAATMVPTIVGRIVTYPIKVILGAYNRIKVALSRPDAIHVKMEALDRISVGLTTPDRIKVTMSAGVRINVNMQQGGT